VGFGVGLVFLKNQFVNRTGQRWGRGLPGHSHISFKKVEISFRAGGDFIQKGGDFMQVGKGKAVSC
jgi:hypothetical protein